MRVDAAPQVSLSRGTTRISLEGAWVYSTPPRKSKSKGDDAHEGGANAFGVVYANELAARAISGEQPAKFPAGSIIVREKLAGAEDTQPELLAVMFKRERGFNPKGGDWEFLTVDATLTKIQERQKKGSCLDCHASRRDNDFVFALPATK